MASGNTLLVFTALANEPPATAYATLDLRNNHPVLNFDATTNESAVFRGVLPRHYGGGGITVYLHVAFASATTNEARFDVSFERIGDAQQNIDSDGFASAQSVDVTAPATSGNVKIANIAFTNGAQIDSIAAGEMFRLKVTRDASNVNDDATGDAQLIAIELKET
jgi:hypothetical protein